MFRNASLVSVVVIMGLLVSACFGGKQYQAIAPYLPTAIVSEDNSAVDLGDYSIRVGIVHHRDGASHESPLQQLQQSNLVNLETSSLTFEDWVSQSGDNKYDLLLIDASLASLGEEDMKKLEEQSRTFAEQGGTLLLAHEFAKIFPQDLTGIQEIKPIESTSLEFDYPEVSYNLQSLQDVWSSFTNTYSQYNGLNPKFHINHEFGVVADTAEPIVTLDGTALFTANKFGEGTVIWANHFLPNEQFITRFDFKAEDEQKYFHYGYATANYLFHSELAAYAAKEKFGYALSNAYGPYGRPGMAWQNHYEEAYSYVLEDMIVWTDLLKEHMQVPTFSLVRSSYNGGQWHSSIAWNENIGTAEAPAFLGSNMHSLFTSGVRMQTEKDYIGFDRYPGYNSLMSDTDKPYRAYITAFDWNNDGKLDLITGNAEGKLMLLLQTAASEGHLFQEPTDIGGVSVSSYAAPTAADINGDGLPDLIVGDGEGTLTYYPNTGTAGSPKFAGGQTVMLNNGQRLQVPGPAAPHLADWNGDGVLDLLVGDGEGYIHLFTGEVSDGTIQWSEAGKLSTGGETIQTGKNAAPHAADWNNDGRLDLLVGSLDGTIRQYFRGEDGGLSDGGILQGQHYNFYGNQNLIAGKNVIPFVVDWNGDGKLDLLTGHMEYGIPRPIDLGFFPYKDQVLKNTKYVTDRYLPLIPHMFLHSNLTDEQEKREIELHKQMFHNLGLEWDKDMGVNHHTWRVNNDVLRTFANQAAAGIWWNFGFNPPNVGTAPRDGIEFLMGVPFDLSKLVPMKGVDGEDVPFVLHVPAPNILNFPKAWDALGRFNLPTTYFEHIEHSQKKGTDVNDKLLNKISSMNEFRNKYNYTFMTEQQMARSFLNTFRGKVGVEMTDNELKLTPDMSEVPWQVKEYENTLGVRIELGEKYKDMELDTDSWFFYKDEHAYFIGVDKPVTIKLTEKSEIDNRIYVVKTNSPALIEQSGESLKVTLNTAGMQEITFHSPVPLEFTGEKMDYVLTEGNNYTVIHYGDKVTFEVKALK